MRFIFSNCLQTSFKADTSMLMCDLKLTLIASQAVQGPMRSGSVYPALAHIYTSSLS